jgi:hypothetical protein
MRGLTRSLGLVVLGGEVAVAEGGELEVAGCGEMEGVSGVGGVAVEGFLPEIGFPAIPELVWPFGFCRGSALAGGRADLSALVSRRSYSGIA